MRFRRRHRMRRGRRRFGRRRFLVRRRRRRGPGRLRIGFRM